MHPMTASMTVTQVGMETLDSITAHRRLVAAVLDMALKDRRKALNTLKRNPNDSYAQHKLKDVESFFTSDWGKFLMSYFPETERVIK